MSNQPQPMTVYAVIGGWDYDGEDFDSLRLFDCRSTADAYRERLTVAEGYDYAKISVREIIMESTLGHALYAS